MFLQGLMLPRGKVRKQKVSTEIYTLKEKPPVLLIVQCGDIFGYFYDERYRIFALTERTCLFEHGRAVFCYAWRNTFETLSTYEELLKEHIFPLGWFSREAFPQEEKRNYIGNYSALEKLSFLYPRVIHPFWRKVEHCIASELNLRHFG